MRVGGDPQLGGDDWDAVVARWLCTAHLERAGFQCTEPRTAANVRALAEQAKRQLSTALDITLRCVYALSYETRAPHT